jgi:hypothetical protein
MTDKNENSIFSDEDWQLLLPGKDITLGSKTLQVRPLDLDNFSTVIRRIVTVTDKFASENINRDNFSSTEKLPAVVDIIMTYIPDVLSLATDIPVKDLKRLPLAKALELVNLVLDVNLESQDGLEKNLQMLVGKLQRVRVE